MSRLERPTTASSNPATKFLEWKSNEKCFSYYDKAIAEKLKLEGLSVDDIKEQANIKVKLPLKVLFLEHYHTVKGWHDGSQKNITSNEVFNISNEPLKVKTFGGIEIGEGIYKDIKDKVKLSGGVYHRSVYVMLEDGSIANLQLKGAVVGGLSKESSLTKVEVDGYSEFYKKNGRLLDNQWIEMKTVADAKKGATKYSIPVFEAGAVITALDNDNANTACAVLQDYVNSYTGKSKVDVLEPATAEAETDGLEF